MELSMGIKERRMSWSVFWMLLAILGAICAGGLYGSWCAVRWLLS
jgi:hypothetical protein